MARLPGTIFTCFVQRETQGSQLPIPVRWPPFAALPRVPPSFYNLRLSTIQISGSELKSTTELARLVDSFPALQQIPRKVPTALWRCQIAECAEMSISAQAKLALDVLAAAPRLGLAAEDPQWSALLDALLASVPSGFKQACMELTNSGGEALDSQAPGRVLLGFSQTKTLGEDQLVANVWVERARATPTRAEGGPAYVSAIILTASFAAAEDGHPPSFDGLREAAGSADLEKLEFFVREGNAQDEAGMRTLVRSVLRREQLDWALNRGVLQLVYCVVDRKTSRWKGIAYIDSGTLLSVLADRSVPTIDATPPTLDDDEYAEYLSLFCTSKRKHYLRRLPALRVERAKAKARLLEETPALLENQGTAVTAPHTSATGGAGGKGTEGRDGEALCGGQEEDGSR
ncbi:hypothetical protein PsYK624_122130 [Phanerochaete sordida]|uniref:Uncharacterized protein n=1 Tax=Phanerochaete sordida TaxID=48140 RepID=A0A9P3GJ10_9APHY|nr:hypothetical protein PsYK624_122130 [Phanerochaete sordida]